MPKTGVRVLAHCRSQPYLLSAAGYVSSIPGHMPEDRVQIDWAKIDAMRAALATPRLRVNQAEDDEVKLLQYDFNDQKRFPRAPSQIELTHLTDLQYGSKGFLRD